MNEYLKGAQKVAGIKETLLFLPSHFRDVASRPDSPDSYRDGIGSSVSRPWRDGRMLKEIYKV